MADGAGNQNPGGPNSPNGPVMPNPNQNPQQNPNNQQPGAVNPANPNDPNNPNKKPGQNQNTPGQEQPPPQPPPPQQQPVQKQPMPESPEETGEYTKGPPGFMEKHGKQLKTVVPIAIVVVLLVVLYVVSAPKPPVITTTTTGTPSYTVTSCEVISAPGDYYITSDINAPSNNGSCLEVKSGNVRIIGNGYALVGKGPYLASGPFSYGVRIYSQSNVSVNHLTILRFGYGVYLNGSDNNQISNITVSNSTISGIYVYRSSYNLLSTDRVTSSGGPGGGIDILYGYNNTVSSTTSQYNSYTGLSLDNSTMNRISNTVLIGNPADMACYGNSTLRYSNEFSASSCYMNSYCNFAYCSESNNQSTPVQYALRSQINTCGSINAGGRYSVSGDLSLGRYMNLSSNASAGVPCILINASDVYLNCNGYIITNATYGILTTFNIYNTTIANCGVDHDSNGIYLDSAVKFTMDSVSANNDDYGIYLVNSTGGTMNNITTRSDSFGIYVNGTTYVTLAKFNASGNGYGVSFDNSTDVYLSNGAVTSSSKVDLYCSPNTYNSTLLSVTSTSCGTSDCNWAAGSCPIKYLPTLTAYPISSCTKIVAPGHYLLEDALNSQGTCLNIKTSDVTLNCNNETITSFGNTGSALNVENATNVTIYGCRITGFQNGLTAHNSSYLNFSSSVMKAGINGVNLTGGQGVVLYNDTVTGFTNNGYWITNINNSVFSYDRAISDLPVYGFSLHGSFNNIIFNDTANFTQTGFYFGDSRNNDVYNNTVNAGNAYDYYCEPNSGGVYDQYGRINKGVSDFGCKWLALISNVYLSQVCTPIDTPNLITLSQDMVYSYGNTCFSIYSTVNTSATDTTINCEGHTVLATNGGTFVSVSNVSDITLENCILIGFSKPVVVAYSKMPVSQISIINNTIVNSGNYSLYVNNAKSSQILNNYLANSTTGMYLYGFNTSEVENNNVQRTTTGIYINGSSSTTLLNNTVNDSSLGVKLSGINQVSFKDNYVINSLSGLSCSTASGAASSGNLDEGGNVCPKSSSCLWISSTSC